MESQAGSVSNEKGLTFEPEWPFSHCMMSFLPPFPGSVETALTLF